MQRTVEIPRACYLFLGDGGDEANEELVGKSRKCTDSLTCQGLEVLYPDD